MGCANTLLDFVSKFNLVDRDRDLYSIHTLTRPLNLTRHSLNLVNESQHNTFYDLFTQIYRDFAETCFMLIPRAEKFSRLGDIYSSLGKLTKLVWKERFQSTKLVDSTGEANEPSCFAYPAGLSTHLFSSVNFLRLQLGLKLISCSCTYFNRKLWNWFQDIHGSILENPKYRSAASITCSCAQGIRGTACACNYQVLYHIVSPFSASSYIGKSLRAPELRFTAHARQVVSPRSTAKDLPAYKQLRKAYFWNFFCVPLYCMPDCTDASLHLHEQQLINQFKPALNCPFVYSKMTTTAYFGANACRKQLRPIGRRTDSPQPFRVIDPSPSTFRVGRVDLPLITITKRLGDPKRRHDVLCTSLRKLPDFKMRNVYNCVLSRLHGRERSIALARLKQISTHHVNFQTSCFLPSVRGFDLKKRITDALRELRCIKGPLVINFHTKCTHSISECLSNQASMNRKLHDISNFSCTCKYTTHKYGLAVNPGQHVCVRLADFPLRTDSVLYTGSAGDNFSYGTGRAGDNFINETSRAGTTHTPVVDCIPSIPVSTRIFPSYCSLFSGVKKAVAKLHRHPKIHGELSSVDDLLKGYKQFLWKIQRAHLPNEDSLRIFAFELHQNFIVTTSVDKCKSTLCIMCPHLYFQRMSTLWLRSPSYKQITLPDNSADDLATACAALQIVGLKKTNPSQHRFGQCNSLPKHKDIYAKDRPLLSYFNNISKPALSVAGRAGFFLLRKFLPDCRIVSSISEVIDQFSEFELSAEYNGFSYGCEAKGDIDNFFTATQHSLLLDACKWFSNILHASNRAKFVAVPTNWRATTPANPIFLKYAGWHQIRSYRNTMRRRYKEEYPIFLSNISRRRHCYAYIPVDAIFAAVSLDLKWAIAMFGTIPLHQQQGIPQGSPLSVFAANLTACFLEARGYQSFISNLNSFLHHTAYRIYICRWVDDVFFILRSRCMIPPETQHRIFTAAAALYSPFVLKKEDEAIFVGLLAQATTESKQRKLRTEVSIPTPHMHAIVPHPSANIPDNMFSAILRGTFVRLMDGASDNESFLRSCLNFFHHLDSLHYSTCIVRQVLKNLATSYAMVNPARQLHEAHLRRNTLRLSWKQNT